MGTRNRKFSPFPGSTLYKSKGAWVVAAEIVETQKVYGRTLAQVEPQWIEEQAKHLLKQRYYEPHWEKKRAAAVAFEQSSLMGLVINPKKKVNFSQIDPEQSREIFIYNALVAADYDARGQYQKHNQALIAHVEDIENRARRRDILVDDTVLYSVFNERVPEWVNNGKSFEKWRKKAEQENPKILYLTEADITQSRTDGVSEFSFPDEMDVKGGKLQIDYQFEPGRAEDGLTIEVPITLLNQIDESKLEWLVPGLEKEKCIALIKSLPKSARKHFVPAPNFSDGFLATNPDREKSLYEQFAQYLKSQTRVDVRPESWRLDQLPSYLLAKIKVTDERGNLLEESSDIATLKQKLQGETKAAVASILADEIDDQHYTDWQFGEVPEEYQYESGGKLLIAHPALVDEGETVRVQLFDQQYSADKAMYKGLLRLFILQLTQQVRYIKKNCMLAERDAIQYAPFGNKHDLADGIVYAAFQFAFLEGQALARTKEQFQQSLNKNKNRLVDAANQFKALLTEILQLHHEIEKTMANNPLPSRDESYADIKLQLQRLFPEHWIKQLQYHHLVEYPRYLKGILLRIKKLQGNVVRDQAAIGELESLWYQYQDKSGSHQERGIDDPALEHYRWMLEEYRISLFAQEIKTKYPVSIKRLEKQWQKVQR